MDVGLESQGRAAELRSTVSLGVDSWISCTVITQSVRSAGNQYTKNRFKMFSKFLFNDYP